MNTIFQSSVSALCIWLLLGLPTGYVLAEIPETYTNDNFWSSEHDQPISFNQDENGDFFGVTASGKTFTQVQIENEYNIRLQKFSIDFAYFYISNKGVIVADNDIEALSIYLTRNTTV